MLAVPVLSPGLKLRSVLPHVLPLFGLSSTPGKETDYAGAPLKLERLPKRWLSVLKVSRLPRQPVEHLSKSELGHVPVPKAVRL